MLSAAEEWSWFVGALGDDGDDGAGETVSFGELAMEKNFWIVFVNDRRKQGNLDDIKNTKKMM